MQDVFADCPVGRVYRNLHGHIEDQGGGHDAAKQFAVVRVYCNLIKLKKCGGINKRNHELKHTKTKNGVGKHTRERRI